jgi:hypothetical protein
MKAQVAAIVESFENETITEAVALEPSRILAELKKDTRIYL